MIADLAKRDSLTRIAAIADVVLHFAPPPAYGEIDVHTRNLLAALARRAKLPQRLIYVSTSGVYGDCGGARVSETRTPHPVTARAVRRLDAESRIRRFSRQTGMDTCLLRVPGIYAANRLPLSRIERGIPILRAQDDVYTNHIHADDLAVIVRACLSRGGNTRIYNASDDSELKMGEYFKLVAQAHRLPVPSFISRQQAERMLPTNLLSFMNESRRMVNRRMKTELRVRLTYANVEVFLKTIDLSCS